ncbi:hypothetical protein DH2020_006412 [Rehmannia glutinosa]|uniref:Uncharacterized protein n=1 Tax=Rehmannia glutinosa TaxID=99300 RepID=A0ABR0XJ77_REHGL
MANILVYLPLSAKINERSSRPSKIACGNESKVGKRSTSLKRGAKFLSNRGLGFRHLRAFNLALLAKQAWRLLCQPHSLIARLLRAKYFPGGTFFNAQLGNRPFWSWRSLIESRSLISMGARRLICLGSTTRIWLDPWLPRSKYFFVHSMPGTQDILATVNSLFNASNSGWNEALVRSTFSLEEASIILSIPIGDTGGDLWCWHHTRNGKFTVKSAYHILVQA